MVAHPGTEASAGRLRALNLPRSITVQATQNRPVALLLGRRWRRVAEVQDDWRIDDEWWREPISRHYYRVVLDDGNPRTIYRDLVAGAWYEQSY